MSYLATVTNSVIDTTNIKNILVQGESTHPEIVFTLDSSLTGLSWYVRASYLSFNLITTSDAITPVETVDDVTVTWTVDASFTTLYGSVQLVLMGMDGDTRIVNAIGYINVARDWSGESMGAITLNLFEQLLAQANLAISHYPYIDDATGDWFNWNATTSEFENTGTHAQGEQGIQGIQGIQGDPGTDGVGVPTGGTTGQGLVKTSGTDYDTSWGDVASLSGGKVSASQASAAIVSVTSARALALTDAGKCLEVDYATAITITIPTNASVAFDIGTEIEIAQVGAGTVTIAGDSGVTVESLNSLTDISGQHASVALKKRATDTWRLEGALA